MTGSPAFNYVRYFERLPPVFLSKRPQNSDAFRCAAANQPIAREFVQLAEDAYLIATSYATRAREAHEQIIRDGDWLLIQLRVRGSGREIFPDGSVIETPGGKCIVTRYPNDTLFVRESDNTTEWRFACLYIRPSALASLLMVNRDDWPEKLRWIIDEACPRTRSIQLPLASSLTLLVNDIFHCQYSGVSRRIFMRSKASEILASILHLSELEGCDYNKPIRLSSSDKRNIELARDILDASLDQHITLSTLARKVGVNRTKLAVGFKQMFGIPVQSYWREVKLNQAREMLRNTDSSVADIAISLGYSDLSAFSRAFRHKFGASPRTSRSN